MLRNYLRYLLGNANFITVLHSNLEYHLNEWNMEKEWAATALFSLSKKIHNVGIFLYPVSQNLLASMYVFITFLQQWKLFIFIFKLILSHWFFLTFRVSLQRKKSNKYKLKCEKTCGFIDSMKFRTTQSNFPC